MLLNTRHTTSICNSYLSITVGFGTSYMPTDTKNGPLSQVEIDNFLDPSIKVVREGNTLCQ